MISHVFLCTDDPTGKTEKIAWIAISKVNVDINNEIGSRRFTMDMCVCLKLGFRARFVRRRPSGSRLLRRRGWIHFGNVSIKSLLTCNIVNSCYTTSNGCQNLCYFRHNYGAAHLSQRLFVKVRVLGSVLFINSNLASD